MTSFLRLTIIFVCAVSASLALQSHMSPGHDTNDIKTRVKLSKDDFILLDRELEDLMEKFYAVQASTAFADSLKESTISVEALELGLTKIRALRANAVQHGETEEEKKNRMIRETKFMQRINEEIDLTPSVKRKK